MRHELAELRTDYANLTNQLSELTISIFQEIQNASELNIKEDGKKADKFKSVGNVEVVDEIHPDSTSDPYDSSSTNGGEDDPLLAAVKAFEKANAKVEVWETPDEFIGAIRSVQPGSLADSYGILDCDRIIQFGDLNTTTFRDLAQFGDYYVSIRGKDITVFILFRSLRFTK